MKCFTFQFRDGTCQEGIATKADDKLGRVVALGEQGRGRLLMKVKFDQRNPPKIDDKETLHGASVVEFSFNETKHHALTAPVPNDSRILIRVRTETSYIRGANGNTKAYWGQPKLVTGGYGAYGDAGRIGSWDDQLWIMDENDVVFVYPSRGDPVVVCIQGDAPSVWSPEDWRQAYVEEFLRTAQPHEVEEAKRLAETRRHTKLVNMLSGATEKRL